jgi:hypothetical protein
MPCIGVVMSNKIQFSVLLVSVLLISACGGGGGGGGSSIMGGGVAPNPTPTYNYSTVDSRLIPILSANMM